MMSPCSSGHSSATFRTAGVKYFPGHLWAWFPVNVAVRCAVPAKVAAQ